MDNIEILKQFHFLRIEWMLLLIPFCIILFFKYKASTKLNTNKNYPSHLSKALNISNNELKKQLPLIFLTSLIILGIFVSVGFSWSRVSSPFGEDNLPLIILMDTSDSMNQEDLAPSRIERSKQKVMDLLEERKGGKAQLISYAGTAHTVMPMTEDIKVFKSLLESVSSEIMPVQGKAPEKAFKIINDIYSQEKSPMSIILITDGLARNTSSKFNEYFDKNKHQLIIWGAGNSINKSEIAFEESKLISLSKDVNGKYIRITNDNSDINYILSKMDNYYQMNENTSQPWNDMSYYLIYLIGFIFLFWFRKGWLVQWGLIFVISMPNPLNEVYANDIESPINNEISSIKQSFINLWLTPDQQGKFHYENEDYEKAAYYFEDPYWKGLSFYKSSNYKESYIYFLRVEKLETDILAANSLARERNYLAARNFYNELIEKHPDNELLIHNRDILNEIMEGIKIFGEGQANTENETSKELGDDQPQTTEGVDEKVAKEQLIQEEFTASDILQDEELNKRWMDRVESDSSLFLKTKFKMQNNKGEEK